MDCVLRYARPKIENVVTTFLAQINVSCVPHLPNRPDLSPLPGDIFIMYEETPSWRTFTTIRSSGEGNGGYFVGPVKMDFRMSDEWGKNAYCMMQYAFFFISFFKLGSLSLVTCVS